MTGKDNSVLYRAFRILKLFDPTRVEMSLTEIAWAADLPLPTAYRITRDLVDLGLLERNDQKIYRIGTGLWEIGVRSSHVLRLREVAMPFMEDLQVAVKQHTSLSILTSSEVLVLERLASHNDVPNISQIGGRLPMHATSPGLLMLAYSDPEFQETILARPLRRYTDRTVTNATELRSILADVRARRYAVADGTVNPLGGGVATAIRDTAGDVIAALSITYGLSEPVVQSVLPALVATARSISRAVSVQAQFSQRI